MRKNIYLIIILLFLFLFQSCYTYNGAMREILSKLTNKIGDENLDVRSKLKIDGFYRSYSYFKTKYIDPDSKEIIELDSVDFNLIIYEDGIVINNFFIKKNYSLDSVKNNLINYLYGDWVNNEFIWGGQWGIYSISGDTIIMQILVKGDIIVPWSFFERKFLIIDDTTLKYLSYQDLLSNTAIQFENNNSLAHFIQADSIPPANPWFKEKRWAWKNEEDWENYVKNKTNEISK